MDSQMSQGGEPGNRSRRWGPEAFRSTTKFFELKGVED